MDSVEYDEVTCVTAGELRERGLPVPMDIPDCAWVPRSSIHYGAVSNDLPEEDRGKRLANISIEVIFTAAFYWVSVTGTVKL